MTACGRLLTANNVSPLSTIPSPLDLGRALINSVSPLGGGSIASFPVCHHSATRLAVNAQGPATVYDDVKEPTQHRNVFHEMDHLVPSLTPRRSPEVVKNDRRNCSEQEHCGGGPPRLPAQYQHNAPAQLDDDRDNDP